MSRILIEKVVARFGERTLANDGAADKAVVAATGFPVRRIVAEGEGLFEFSRPVAECALENAGGGEEESAGDDVLEALGLSAGGGDSDRSA